jgi:GLPGLI family protein
MKNRLFLLLITISLSANAQKAIKVTYVKSSNGTVVENQDRVVLLASKNTSLVTSEKILSQKADFPIEQTFVDFTTGKLYQTSQFKNGRQIVSTDSMALKNYKFELLDDVKKILGYNCHKAKITINSNTIEVWYTQELNISGAPSLLGQNLGLVLETNRNGNYQVLAEKVEKLKNIPGALVLPESGKSVDQLTYRDLLWKSRFTTIPVFKKEIINFSDASKSDDSILRFARGTIIVKKIKFPEIKKGSQIFTDVTEQSNGDAYDRTGSVFLIPTDNPVSFLDGLQNGAKTLPIYDNGNGKQYQGVARTENYSPLLELMRFYTPFGVKQYNTIEQKDRMWQDSVFYRQDISDLAPALSDKEVYIGMNIGNYDKGGHKASLNITIHPEEDSKKPDTWVMPLFDTNNVMEMAGQEYGTMFSTDKGLEITFNLTKEVKNVKLRYIATGHGGWENGDEFVPKKNTILLDGKEAFAFTPWRSDCGSYRLSNPASGNFENGLSSSDYSRSNWCPGTVTNPVWIDLGNLKSGPHTIQVKIPLGQSESGSFSSWNVSGVLEGE